MLLDARTIADGTELEYDLAVVGAGPAGITIVDRLRTAGLSIGLVESGGFDLELRTQRLYRGENVGHTYYPLDTCRYRLFGGSSNRWGGWCRPLDPIDFERRTWIPGSGWPIGAAELEPFYGEAARLLELSAPGFELSRWSARLPPPLPIAGEDFEHAIIRYSPGTNFAECYGPPILAAPNVTTLIHANVDRDNARFQRRACRCAARAHAHGPVVDDSGPRGRPRDGWNRERPPAARLAGTGLPASAMSTTLWAATSWSTSTSRTGTFQRWAGR